MEYPRTMTRGKRASVELDSASIDVEGDRCILEVDEVRVDSFDGRFIIWIFQTPVMITSDENLMWMWLDTHPVQSSIHFL